MKNIGVILAGCGYLDGAEIREAVLTLLSIDQHGAKAKIFAPNIDQHHVVNHLSGEETNETRNVLLESARIARGEIQDLENLDMNELDALILPGGFGVAKNLSSLAFDGADAKINEKLNHVLHQALELKKPIGAICISPAVICLGINQAKPTLTIGTDGATANVIETLGGTHEQTQAHEVSIDEKNKIVSTPAYMHGEAPISKICIGIDKCIKKVLDLCE